MIMRMLVLLMVLMILMITMLTMTDKRTRPGCSREIATMQSEVAVR